ncbi:DDE-type integrase/transposase/recombinase [Staphylococcus aureus]
MPVKNELAPWPEPSGPWERIHIDFAGPMEGWMFLIVVDAYSRWPEVVQVRSATTSSTLIELNRMFARYGNPKTLVSDNGTQFTSTEFQRFCQENMVNHIRIPPFNPQSNGQAERFVDTFKRTFQKLKGEGVTETVIQKFLSTYRSIDTMSICSWTEITSGKLLRQTFKE